jgi:hypothetical protein
MRFAYADPPYLGCGAKFYGKHHAAAADYDRIETHAALVDRLCAEFPDGWAMSLHEPSLRHILPLCPEDCRVGAWVKPFHAFKKGVRPAYAWEPVIYRGGRNKKHPAPPKGGKATTPKDWVAANMTLKKGLTGAKPDAFCFWIFDLLGMRRDDDLVDLFPGSGAVTRAWESWRAQSNLFTPSVA